MSMYRFDCCTDFLYWEQKSSPGFPATSRRRPLNILKLTGVQVESGRGLPCREWIGIRGICLLSGALVSVAACQCHSSQLYCEDVIHLCLGKIHRREMRKDRSCRTGGEYY